MKNLVSLLAASLLLLSMQTFASEPQAHGKHAGHPKQTVESSAKKEFRALDKNKDGKVSKAEMPVKHPMAAHYSMMDTNKDGVLSEAEFTAH